MLKFTQFINLLESKTEQPFARKPEEVSPLETKMGKTLHDFLHHLSSPSLHGDELNESIFEEETNTWVPPKKQPSFSKSALKLTPAQVAKANKGLRTFGMTIDQRPDNDIEKILKKGRENAPVGVNLNKHIKKGFHSAFVEGETPEETKRKAKEAQAHFRNFLRERGGQKAKDANLTGDNGKTQLSTGQGIQTTGLSLAPHHSSGYKHDLCPDASAECRENCLGFTAGGNIQYPEASFRAKLLRTQYLHEHPEHFARLMSHEISENEKWCDENHTIHDKDGNVVGHRNKKTGKISSYIPLTQKGKDAKKEEKMKNEEFLRSGIESGTHTTKVNKSGFRGNMTSDLHWEKLMPHSFFNRHHKTQFYDYTKNAKRVKESDKLPKNYALALSHTGTGHEESNDRDTIEALRNGGVVAMVHHAGKGIPIPTHVENVETGERWRIVNGDKDDNVYDRQTSQEKKKKIGVVSGLKLKGVSPAKAGHFANKVDDDGIIRIDPRVGEKMRAEKAAALQAEFEKRSELYRQKAGEAIEKAKAANLARKNS